MHEQLPWRNCLAKPIDRKSTRLNSSHLVISYAVFCLKKKKNVAVTAETKNEILKEFERHDTDAGSQEAQVALMAIHGKMPTAHPEDHPHCPHDVHELV